MKPLEQFIPRCIWMLSKECANVVPEETVILKVVDPVHPQLNFISHNVVVLAGAVSQLAKAGPLRFCSI